MPPPRRAYSTKSLLIAALLGGLLGFTWWWWRGRRGWQSARLRRTRLGAVVAGLALITLGTTWRTVAAVQSTSPCSPPGGAQAAPVSSLDASLLAEKVLTWPETGLGMLYARVDHAPDCLSQSAGYYVAVNADNPAVTGATNLGDIVLTPRFDLTPDELSGLAAHEAGHRPQWAVSTAIGGPLAFPIAYGIDNFFFPGSHNHFERAAGLEGGFYPDTGTGPVIGPAQVVVLVLAGAGLVAWLTIRYRRKSSR